MGLFSSRRRYFVAVGLLAVGAIALANWSPRDEAPGPDRFWFMGPLSPFGASASSSVKPVQMELKNSKQVITKLSIPRAYIATVSEPEKTQQSFVNLVVYLPDYLPRYLADKAGHRTQGERAGPFRLRSEDEVSISLRPTIRGAIQKGVEWEKSHAVPYGRYKDRFELYYRYNTQQSSGYLFPIGRDDVSIEFFINPNTQKMVTCTIRYNLNDDVDIRVIIGAAHLDQYERIMKSISDLISTFLVSDGPPKA